ncbi:MAG TPA: ArdC family protein [Candidatus Helicobacter avicola]|nr:ArdC family protein [Candidatus Helicobacter avicola]
METNQTFQKAERSYEEMIEGIKNNAIISIATSIKNQNAPFLKHQNVEDLQRAYNANTGASYSGINSLLLDIKKAEMGYETNQWVNTLQAQMLGASKEEIEAAKSKWQENSVKIHYIQTKERIPVYSDRPLLDQDGNQRILKDGSPAFEYARDENDKIKYETKDITPVLKEERLYNIANFPSIKQEKIKALNPEIERMHIYKHSKKENAKKSMGVILEDIADKFYPVTREQIETYFKAQNFKKDYDVPQALNDRQKEQINTIVSKAVEESKKAQAPKQETQQKEVEKEQQATKQNTQTKKPKGRTR